MKKRIRFKQTPSLRERIELWAEKLRIRAADMPPGREKELLMKKIPAASTASFVDAWVNFRGRQPPK